jgi:hypothetical protein
VSQGFRLAAGCVLALVAAPFLAAGWALTSVGRVLMRVADGLNPI